VSPLAARSGINTPIAESNRKYKIYFEMKTVLLNSIKRSFFIFSFLFSFFMPLEGVLADQAGLYLSPASGTYQLNSTFSVLVGINSGGNPINAAEGAISFDPNQLSVISISKTGTIFSLWTNEPFFSNSQGNISFGGGSPSAFNGQAGTIMKIVFKAKNSGQARVSFSSGAILAADGRGTNILGNMAGGIYDLKSDNAVVQPEPEITEPEPETQAGTPDAPAVFSKTHPDSSKWYNDPNPEFSWQVPAEVTALRLLVGRNASAIPSVLYDQPISEKRIENFEDGVWYFSAQFKNNFGWGKIARFKFQIDLKPPEKFEVKIKEGNKTSNAQPTLIFEATDQISGIDHYEIKIDQQASVSTKEKEFKLPPQSSGKHIIESKAFDKAGNSALATAEIEITSLEAPVIVEFPKELYPGTPLLIKGLAPSGSTVKIHLENEKTGETIGETKTGEDGTWSYVDFSIKESGPYSIFVHTEDGFGGKSLPSPKITVLAVRPVFIRIGDMSITSFAVLVILAILVVIVLLFTFLAWGRRKKKIRKEISETEVALTKAFKALREEAGDQIARLDGKKSLSKSEQIACDNLKEALKIAESYISDKLKDISDELK